MVGRNYKLFETCTDTELSKKWGLSCERIRQLRIEKHYSHISSKKLASDRNYNKLIKYLKLNKHKVFYVSIMQNTIGIYNLYGKEINLTYIQKICKVEKINLKLPSKKADDHGYERYRRKLCKCVICKLANGLKSRYLYQGNPISTFKATELAQKYYKVYTNDKSRKKQKFYTKIDKVLGI